MNLRVRISVFASGPQKDEDIHMESTTLEHDHVRRLSADGLMSIAVQRGCSHYAPLTRGRAVDPGKATLPDEAVAVALMQGDPSERFDHIRAGAMLLSKLSNDAGEIGRRAQALGVEDRIRHVAEIAISVGDHPDFWKGIVESLGERVEMNERERLPGHSRFMSLSGVGRPGQMRQNVWLRPRIMAAS